MSRLYPIAHGSQILSLNLPKKCHFSATSVHDNVNVKALGKVTRRLLRHDALAESQRDSAMKPRVARDELPRVQFNHDSQPQQGCGGVGFSMAPVAQPFQGWILRVLFPTSQPWALLRNPFGILFGLYGLLFCGIFLFCVPKSHGDDATFGPLYHEFGLTLASGHRTEYLGPLFYTERKESTRLWAAPPVMSYTLDEEVDFAEFDFFYPILTYDRFGSEYRFHIGQLFSFAGGHTQTDTNVARFTLFPFYFQQRSPIPEKNYTAVVPFYGHLKNRLFRDEVNFVMMPFYVQSKKRDVVTDNYVYPFFHLRHGTGLEGWQFWPLLGHERKIPTISTNVWHETESSAGHEKRF